MIWIALGMVTFMAMLPLGIAIERRPRGPGRREAALALHQAQLAEAERDLATSVNVASEQLGVVTDVQRRILASADEREVELTDGARAPLLAALAFVPLIALALYLASGSPRLPSVAGESVVAEPTLSVEAEDKVLSSLRARAMSSPTNSPAARSAYIALGKVEAGHGDMAAAAAAWTVALSISFDATLAAATAEASSESSGRVDTAARELFQKALASAPADAPWRSMVVKRLAEAATGDGGQRGLSPAQ
jgi:cytochrome c-type biogenesis protein CcmH